MRKLLIPTAAVIGGLTAGVLSQGEESLPPWKAPEMAVPGSVIRRYSGWFIPQEYLTAERHGKVLKRYWRNYDPIYNPRVEAWVYADGTVYEVNYVYPSMWDDQQYPVSARIAINQRLRDRRKSR